MSTRLPRFPWWSSVDLAVSVLDRRRERRICDFVAEFKNTPEVVDAIARRGLGALTEVDQAAAREVAAAVVPLRGSAIRAWRRELLAPFKDTVPARTGLLAELGPPFPVVDAKSQGLSPEALITHLLRARWHFANLCRAEGRDAKAIDRRLRVLVRRMIATLMPLPGEGRSRSSLSLDDRLHRIVEGWLPRISRNARCRIVARVRLGFRASKDEVIVHAGRLVERLRKRERGATRSRTAAETANRGRVARGGKNRLGKRP